VRRWGHDVAAKPFVLIEEMQAAIRIYPDGHPTSYCAPWGQSMLLVRRQCEPGTADITLHSAPIPHTRATLRALRDALRAHGLHAVYSLRGDGHTIPGAVEVCPGVWRLDLSNIEYPLCHT
jgi:hypothetical protein